ncbi:hypothetical protein Dimus_010184 [Dionaea muscipula]
MSRSNVATTMQRSRSQQGNNRLQPLLPGFSNSKEGLRKMQGNKLQFSNRLQLLQPGFSKLQGSKLDRASGGDRGSGWGYP